MFSHLTLQSRYSAIHISQLNLSKNVYEEVSYEQLNKIYNRTSGAALMISGFMAPKQTHFLGGGKLHFYLLSSFDYAQVLYGQLCFFVFFCSPIPQLLCLKTNKEL